MQKNTETKSQPHTSFVVGLSGGLGQSIAHEMIKHSFDLHGSYKNNPTPHSKYKLDITDSLSIETLARLFHNRGTRFNSLIINSGVSTLGPQLSISNEDYEKSFHANFLGPRQVLKAFLPLLKPNAKILLIGSASSWGNLPFTGSYALSKRILRDFAEILRQEFALDRKTSQIKLILIEPGAYKTAIWDSGSKSMEKNLGNHKTISKAFQDSVRFASDPAPFGKKIVRILESRSPCSYYRFGPMSSLSRLTEWVPIRTRITVIQLLRIFGFEFHSA